MMPLSRSENFVTSTAVPCGDLLIEAQQQLFAHELGADLLFRHVGDHIVRKQLRPRHGKLRKLTEEFLEPVAVLSRHRTIARHGAAAE